MTTPSSKELNERGLLREDAKSMSKLTREQLVELESREKTSKEKRADVFLIVLPIICAIERRYIPCSFCF